MKHNEYTYSHIMSIHQTHGRRPNRPKDTTLKIIHVHFRVGFLRRVRPTNAVGVIEWNRIESHLCHARQSNSNFFPRTQRTRVFLFLFF